MKVQEEKITKLRTKIASVILSCETLDQLQACETWFYRIRLTHPNREFLQGHFNNMFTYMYLNQRKKFYREDNLLQ